MCDSDDYATPIVSAWRKARKEHRCFACREAIRAGDRYHYTAESSEGFAQFKHCARCWAMLGAILEAGAESAQYDLHCGTSWQEAFDAEPPEDVARLAFMTPEEAQRTVPTRSAWDDEVGEGKQR